MLSTQLSNDIEKMLLMRSLDQQKLLLEKFRKKLEYEINQQSALLLNSHLISPQDKLVAQQYFDQYRDQKVKQFDQQYT